MISILKILSALKRMTVKELKNSIFQNYYRQIGCTKENSYPSMKNQMKKYLLLLATNLHVACSANEY